MVLFDFIFALLNKILGHGAVISNTVNLLRLLMAKELISTTMMNVEHGNQ